MTKQSGYWKKKENRVKAIKELVENLGKPVTEVTQRDFKNNGLRALLTNYYSSSPSRALKDAGYDFKEWERGQTITGYWEKRDNRVKVTRWLVEKLDKPITQITAKDFKEHNLGGLLGSYYSGSPYFALKDAGYNIKEWEMSKTPQGYWKKKENRVKVTRWLVEKLDKPITQITAKDFKENGLRGILVYYSDSPFKAIKDAGCDVEEWQMKIVPQTYWKKRENRVKATKRMVEKLDKPITQITAKDFCENELRGVLVYYSDSPFKALKDARYDVEEWQMSIVPHAYWKKKENRVNAIRELVEKLDKLIIETTIRDFRDNGLRGVLVYYSDSPFLTLTDAGYNVTQEEMRHGAFTSGAMRYKSEHGHKFRSMEERDLDNIFWSYSLTNHKHNVRYPDSKKNCDFVFGGKYWVEYAGLLGIDPKFTGKSYDEKIEEKKKIARKNNLDLTIITRKDFISGNYLKKVNHIINDLGSFNQNLDEFF